MLIKFSDAVSGGYDPYPSFKAMVDQLCENGANVFIKKASSTVISIYAFGVGAERGGIPLCIETGLLVDSATAQSDAATDFPAATVLPNDSGGPSPTVSV